MTVDYYSYTISQVLAVFFEQFNWTYIVALMATADKDDNSSEHPWPYLKSIFEIYHTPPHPATPLPHTHVLSGWDGGC